MPANVDDIPALSTYYKVEKNGFTSNQDHSPSVNPGETACVTIERTIEYWGDNVISSMEADKGKRKKEATQKSSLRYKGIDIYGLFGNVKSVTEDFAKLKFDQAGNLVYILNDFGDEATYQYVTPTSYKVEGWEDHIVNIEIKDGSRMDVCPDAYTNTELDQEYTFDSRNRIISHKFSSHRKLLITKIPESSDCFGCSF